MSLLPWFVAFLLFRHCEPLARNDGLIFRFAWRLQLSRRPLDLAAGGVGGTCGLFAGYRILPREHVVGIALRPSSLSRAHTALQTSGAPPVPTGPPPPDVPPAPT